MVDTQKVAAYVRKQRIKMAFWVIVTVLTQLTTWRIMLSYYMTAGSTWLVWAAALLGIVAGAAVLKLAFWMLREIAEESQDKWGSSYETVVRITERLFKRRGIRMPIVGLWKGAFFEGSLKAMLQAAGRDKLLGKLLPLNAGMADSAFRKDIMLVGEKLPEILTEAELEAVLAHELRHGDQPENKVAFVPLFGQLMIEFTFLICAPHYLFAAGWSTPTWEVLFAGWALLRLNASAVQTAMAAFSRAREHETDAEATLDIETPESLIAALEKITRAVEEICSGIEPKPAHKRSHPPVKARARALRALV